MMSKAFKGVFKWCSNAFSPLVVAVAICGLGATPTTAQPSAQANAQKSINQQKEAVKAKREVVEPRVKAHEQRVEAFEKERKTYQEKEAEIKRKDERVASVENYLSFLLVEGLPIFGNAANSHYTSQPNGTGSFRSFSFASALGNYMKPAYEISYRAYVTTFLDVRDRETFDAYVAANFETYLWGGQDLRTGEQIEGALSDHFHPKHYADLPEERRNDMKEKYVEQMKKSPDVSSNATQMAEQMNPLFFAAWDAFWLECGLAVTTTVQELWAEERVPIVEAQQQKAVELREEYLAIEKEKREIQNLKNELVYMENTLKQAIEDYNRLYKK